MLNPLVSIIVPVYNVAMYLEYCVNSLLMQTYGHIEILLIDDGSSDESPRICDSFSDMYSNIKTFHKINGGQGSARNYGLNLASGEYYCFIDSDDYIAKDFVEKLLKGVLENSCEIAIVGFAKVTAGFVSPFPLQANVCGVVNMEDAMVLFLRQFPEMNSVSNKLYKNTIFDGIRFAEGVIYEDFEIIYQLIGRARKVFFVNELLYYYRVRENSTMTRTQYTGKKCLDLIAHTCQLKRYIDSNLPHLRNHFLYCQYISYSTTYMSLLLSSMPVSCEKKSIKRESIRLGLKLLTSPDMKKRDYIRLFMMMLPWKLFLLIHGIYHKNIKIFRKIVY